MGVRRGATTDPAIVHIGWSGALALAALVVAIALTHPPANARFSDTSAVLGFITAAAVGIERVIEAFWTIVGGVAGSYWPLTAVRDQVSTLVGDLDRAMTGFNDAATKGLTEAEATVGRFQKQLPIVNNAATAFAARLASANARRTTIGGAGPLDGQRAQLIAAAASQHVDYVTQQYGRALPELEQTGRAVQATINGLQDFVATFKDNPGRRLLSIYLGMMLGLATAWGFGLDLFSAALAQGSAQTPAPVPAVPGAAAAAHIVLTGIIIGLGSNPTHEVIRSIQEYKKGQKGDNLSTPNLPSSPTPGTAPAPANAIPTSPAPVSGSPAVDLTPRLARGLQSLSNRPREY